MLDIPNNGRKTNASIKIRFQIQILNIVICIDISKIEPVKKYDGTYVKPRPGLRHCWSSRP